MREILRAYHLKRLSAHIEAHLTDGLFCFNKSYLYEMNRGRVIVISDGDSVEVWGSLTELCKVHGIAYHSIKTKDYPFTYKGVTFSRVDFRSKPNKGHVKFS